MCGSLIGSDNGEIKALHHSLRDFLLSSKPNAGRMDESGGEVDPADANLAIARTLLTYLENPRLDNYDAKDRGSKSYYPLVEYATLYWVHHVSQSREDNTLGEQIRRFFQAQTWFKHLLPLLLPRSVLTVPSRAPINARLFYLIMLKLQLAGYFPPEERDEFSALFCRRLLETYERLLEEARGQGNPGVLLLQRLIELGELNTWLPGR